MPRRYDDAIVYRRRASGECIMDRQCRQCRREFVGDRNICSVCRNRQRWAQGKFDKRYHRRYYRKYLSKKAVRRQHASNRQKKKPALWPRQVALERHTERIHKEIAAIEAAGLTVESTIGEIIDAGVVLDGSFPSLLRSRPDDDARRTSVRLRSSQDCGLAG